MNRLWRINYFLLGLALGLGVCRYACADGLANHINVNIYDSRTDSNMVIVEICHEEMKTCDQLEIEREKLMTDEVVRWFELITGEKYEQNYNW